MQKNQLGNTLASRLKVARKRCRYTQKTLANACGVSQQTIAAIEAGKVQQPYRETLMKIAKTLDVSPAWLQVGIEELEHLDEHALKMAMLAMSLSPQQRKLMAMQMETMLSEESVDSSPSHSVDN